MEVQVQGHQVHFERSGKGPPALFLHGVPDTGDIWKDVIAGAQQRYTCYAPDLMGIGRSQENPGFDYSFDGYADWVEALVQALGITEPVTLVVHDWGGLIGLAWASQYPQRIARVLIMNTAFTPLYRWHFWARVWRTPLLGEFSMLVMNRALFRQQLQRGSRKLTLAQIDEAYHAFHPAARAVVLRLYRSADPPKLVGKETAFAALAQRVPVKVLWGEHDPYVPRWVAATFHTEDVEMLPDSGHWVPLEESAKVAEALLRM
ncbi:MAG: alpha/beta fold hydrolase [Nevskia sp.]|nr:alpha/beta fold hydrolase [Nevskia sp.]